MPPTEGSDCLLRTLVKRTLGLLLSFLKFLLLLLLLSEGSWFVRCGFALASASFTLSLMSVEGSVGPP